VRREEVFTLIVGLLGIFSGLGLARFAYTVILEPMREGLMVNYTEMGVIASANFFGYVLFSPFAGYLASKHGSKKIVVSSLLLITITLFLTSFSTSFIDAGIFRFLTGIGSAGVNVGIVGLAAKWFEIEKRGLALGIINTGSSVGIIFAGFALPAVILAYDWRAGWQFLAVISFIVFLLSLWLRETPERFTPESKIPIAGVYRERRLVFLGASYVFFGSSYIIFVTFFTSHLINRGIDYTTSSFLWSMLGFLSIAGSVLWGRTSDRIGRKTALQIVYTLMGFAFITFAFTQSIFTASLATFMTGLSMLSIPPLVQAYCGDIAGKESASAAIGFVTLFFGIGQMFGPAFGGYLADVTGGFLLPLISAGIMSLSGALLMRKT